MRTSLDRHLPLYVSFYLRQFHRRSSIESSTVRAWWLSQTARAEN
ncbi:hypothetical protein [Chamaesiphon polymorphus]|nr:hypothetical protein [Chamaesiphon polymorphus]